MHDQKSKDMRFSGIERLITNTGLERLVKSHALVVGIGGVGSWCAEALVRSGLGHITLVDLDDVCVTNINRQLHALDSTIGQSKIDVMKKRLIEISPNCQINLIHEFFDQKTKELILDHPFDIIIDCIDSLYNKCLLIDEAKKRKIPIITVGGAGGKIDPTQIRVNDLGLSTNDTLLKRVRKSLKREWNWNRTEGEVWDVMAVYSIERSRFLDQDGQLKFVPNLKQNSRIDCNSGIGTATWMTGSFGFYAASLAVKQLLSNEN